MKEIAFKDLEQNDLVASEQYLVNIIRARYPHLDIRSGTALRDLLVTPDAALHAVFSKQAAEQRKVSSLQSLLEALASGETVDTEDVSRIMSNFNISSTAGTSARGSVRVVVSSARSYSIQRGFRFDTLDGISFTADSSVVATEQPVNDNDIKLYRGTSNFYFIVPVTCKTTGSSGNIAAGTALSIASSLSGFVAASAYGDFSGGADTEDLSSVKARIPVALSNRGLLTATSVEATLRDRFDETDHPIVAVSVVGYGNPAQLRDKHNAFGVGVGGRADIYVRNFTAPYTRTVQADFKFDEKIGKLCADIAVPGMYNVASVSDSDTDALSSYAFSTEYTSPDQLPDGHDFDVSSDGTELAGTVWRTCRVLVEPTAGSKDDKVLSVGMICLPMATDIQSYIDDPSVRNVGVDYVVRCPAVCRVSINAVCRYEYGLVFDVDAAKSALANYVNTTGFVGRITRSEIACVLQASGAKSVDINDAYMLTGYVVDAKGVTHKLSGDALDLDDIEVPTSMLTKDTCVFSTTVGNINITAVPA